MSIEYKQAVIKAIKETKELYQMGIEREGLRVSEEGYLSQEPHPEVFGEKIKNYHFKTDFCEYQPELVTAPAKSADKAYEALGKLTTILKSQIEQKQELLWPQSMPCILPEEDKIKTASHPSEEAKPLRDYLEMVREKYGPVVQTICGIHCNISFSDAFFASLQQLIGNTEKLRDFKDATYLKMLRNYMRYSWLSLLLTGASPAVHESYGAVIPGLKKDERGFFIGKYALSLRTSKIGYHNPEKIQMDYCTVETLTQGLKDAVENGLLIDAGELFASIKAKGKANVDPIPSLREEGIQYLELRNMDLNPFNANGIAKEELEWIPLFMLYLLILPETEYADWQEEAEDNALRVAVEGRNPKLCLQRDGKEIPLVVWCEELSEGFSNLNREIKLCKADVLEQIIRHMLYPKEGYGAKIYERIQKEGYVEANLSLVKVNGSKSIK